MSGPDHDESGPRPGRIARVGGYFGRRVGNPFISAVGRDTLYKGADSARDVLKPERVSRAEAMAAYKGRYQDGGRDRFSQLVVQRGLGEDDLRQLERMRLLQFRAMLVVSLLALLIGSAVPFWTDDWLILISGLIFGLFSLIFLMIGLRHDFAAWQIRSRRFGSIRNYLEERWGRGP